MTLVANRTDRELLEAAQAGDEQAFALLHDRYRPLVFRIALRTLGRTDDAEDICQEVFFRLYRQPPQLTDHPHALRLWLARVTTNAALNLLRSQRRARFHWSRLLRLDRLFDDQRPTAEWNETSLLVQSVLEKLSDRDRALLALRVSGFSYEEIAMLLDLRPTSVGTLLARAERRFRERYRALLGENGEEVHE